MSSEVLKICDPWQYHSNFLNESVYPNGRSVESFRPISLQMGVKVSAAGSSLARQGSATVTCIIEPFLGVTSDSPSIIPHLRAVATISQTVVGEAEVMTHQLIDQNAFCTKDSLKTANGRLTWILHLHIMILDTDGAVFDALVTSIIGALYNLRLPYVTSTCDPDIPININEIKLGEELFPVELSNIPVSCTFIVYEEKDKEAKILCDPISELFELLPNIVTVVVGNNGVLFRIAQNGTCGNVKTIQRMVEIATGRQKIIANSMMEAKKQSLNSSRK